MTKKTTTKASKGTPAPKFYERGDGEKYEVKDLTQVHEGKRWAIYNQDGQFVDSGPKKHAGIATRDPDASDDSEE